MTKAGDRLIGAAREIEFVNGSTISFTGTDEAFHSFESEDWWEAPQDDSLNPVSNNPPTK